MNLRNLQLAYTKDGLSLISQASKDFDYFLDSDLKIPLVYCEGSVNTPYWRKQPNVDISVLVGYFKGESLEHYNAKMNIAHTKTLYFSDEVDDILFKGASSKVEYRCKTIKKIIDVVLFDQNNNPIIGVEIYNKSKKSHSDILEFHKLNFPIYEYNINDGTISILHNGDNSDKSITTRGAVRTGQRYIQKQQKRIIQLKKGIKRCDRRGKKIDKEIRKRWRNYYRFMEEGEECIRPMKYLEILINKNIKKIYNPIKK